MGPEEDLPTENGQEAWGLPLSHDTQLMAPSLPTPPGTVHTFLPQFCKRLVTWAQRAMDRNQYA